MSTFMVAKNLSKVDSVLWENDKIKLFVCKLYLAMKTAFKNEYF